MGMLVVRHNDLTESMEEVLSQFFGESVQIESRSGNHGEIVTSVTGDYITSDVGWEIERLDWVLSTDFFYDGDD